MRSMQIWGEAVGSDMTMTVMLNGQQVFRGSIPSRDQWSLRNYTSQGANWILAQFDFPMETHGKVPLSLQVTGGDLYYTQTKTNYHGDKIAQYVGISPDASWPNGRPASDDEIMQDAKTLDPIQWLTKYGQRRRECLILELISSAENWGESNGTNTVDDDGRSNVRIQGQAVSMDTAAREQHKLLGDWAYWVPGNQTLTCELEIIPPGVIIPPIA